MEKLQQVTKNEHATEGERKAAEAAVDAAERNLPKGAHATEATAHTPPPAPKAVEATPKAPEVKPVSPLESAQASLKEQQATVDRLKEQGCKAFEEAQADLKNLKDHVAELSKASPGEVRAGEQATEKAREAQTSALRQEERELQDQVGRLTGTDGAADAQRRLNEVRQQIGKMDKAA